jgi:hypothetical protein
MTQHTQGNWSVLPEECDKPYLRIRGTRLGGRYKIANVITPIYDGADSQEAEETRANARLISAAPELLEAIEELLAWGSDPNTPHGKIALEHAEAAIAKATKE